jgi:hypothetical protein
VLRFAADQNLNWRIVRGLRRRVAEVDIVHLSQVGLSRTVDPLVLAWAAGESRIVLTHDVATMMRFACERVADELPMPGVFEVPKYLAVGVEIEDVLTVIGASIEGEWDGRVLYLPL